MQKSNFPLDFEPRFVAFTQNQQLAVFGLQQIAVFGFLGGTLEKNKT
jgi:hypothetical protein